jgi:hypothetical protein
MRYFINAVSHLCAMISGQKKNSRSRWSMKSTGFVSGKPGVSAMVNGSDQARCVRLHRAPRIRTSSAVRSPDPWNQHTSRSPFGSTIETSLCHDSSGKMISPEYSGAAAGAMTDAAIARRAAKGSAAGRDVEVTDLAAARSLPRKSMFTCSKSR